MNEENGGCRYVFDPGTWEEKHGTASELDRDVLTEAGIWRCPHEKRDDGKYCLFHAPPSETDASEVRDALLGRISGPGEEGKQFIGATFGDLDLDYALLESEDNHQIDLRHARFEGELTMKSAIVRQPLHLEAATFEADGKFVDATFDGGAYFSKTEFQQKAYFIGATFARGGIFYKSTFGGDTEFSNATFEGSTDFVNSSFHRVHFRETRFTERVDFKRATFRFGMFWGCRFEADALFNEAEFRGRVNFQEADFEAKVRFVDAEIASDTCYVDLQGASLSNGTLSQPGTGEILYDLEGAVLGDLDLSAERSSGELFEFFRVLNTTFDGFDFGRYRDALNASNWTLHEPVRSDLPGAELTEPTAGQLENTYLKAKNGAIDIGDAKAAAEFFRWEMTYRRHQYVAGIRGETDGWRERLKSGWQWSANAALALTSGYGERPSRVIAFSTGVVVGFAVLFALAGPDLPYDARIGYLLLSLESFVTLVLGGAETVENPWIRLLAQVEGFTGAFLIALFVFTLTRSIHR